MKMLYALIAIVGAQYVSAYLALPTFARLILQVLAALVFPRLMAKIFPPETLVGKKAPPLEGLTYMHGEPAKLGNKGRVTVVEFWATWCPPCRTSIPHLAKLYGQFKDKVDFVGISNEQAAPVQDFLQTSAGKAFTYPCAIDPSGAVKGYPVSGIPAAFVVDGNGVVTWQGHPMSGLDAAIQAALGGTDSAAAKDE